MTFSPSAKRLIMPVGKGSTDISWDPDSTRLGGVPRSAPYYTTHIPYEPLVTPRIAEDSEGVRYPVAADCQPRLAERWESSADKKTWTLWLRKGVMSHYGNELVAESVRWSWERVYHLQRVGYWRSRHLGRLERAEDIEVVDSHTLRFHLAHPNPEFDQYWSFATNNIFDATEAKKHVTEADPWAAEWLTHNISGFGAFSLAEKQPGVLRFSARDEYWAGRPGVDELIQVEVEDREAAMRMAEAGEANLLLGLYPEELARFAGRPEYTIIRARANHSTLEFNWLEAPFDDQRVRQAVSYALPYDRILQQVYRGFAKQSKSPIPTCSPQSTEEFWQYQTDMAKAKELMAASAHPAGFQTALYIQPSYESVRFAEIVRQAVLPLGIVIEVRLQTSLPFNTKVPMWFREECGHALYEGMYDLGHDYDPPPNMWGNKNIVHPMWTEKMRAIREAPADQQLALYHAIQRDILEFAPCVHIAEIDTGWVIRGEVDPWALGPLFLGAETTVWSTHRQMMGGFW